MISWVIIASLGLALNPQCKSIKPENDVTPGVVNTYGQLSVREGYVVNQYGDAVSLEGMSLFWSQWEEGKKYYNYHCLKWLRDDWNCEIIRAAMGVEGNAYLKNPKREKAKITRVIEACIDLGMYVIADWHAHYAEEHTAEAVAFFSEIAEKYGEFPNLIYEIYNEPLRVSWKEDLVPYMEEVISAIRQHDPDNIIIVGSPFWSQNVDEVADDPLDFNNIAYSVHFYAAIHKQWLRDKAQIAIDSGLTLWVSEFGTCKANGDGEIDYEEMELWFDFMEKYKISWCNWSVTDKEETSAILKPGGSRKGGWNENDLSASGRYIRKKMKDINARPY